MAGNIENTQNNGVNDNYYILWDRYAKVTFKVKNGDETEEIEFERFQVENGVDYSPDFEIQTEFDITESTNIAKIVIYIVIFVCTGCGLWSLFEPLRL